nr:LysM domain-containing protein [Saccharopolyspora gloriosae]
MGRPRSVPVGRALRAAAGATGLPHRPGGDPPARLRRAGSRHRGNTDLNVSLVDLPVLTGGTAPPPAPPAPPAPETYVVQPGDTLSGIGAKVGVAWQSIAQANGISDPNLIYVGQVLRIPR